MDEFSPEVRQYIENLRLRYRQEALQAIENAKRQGYDEGHAKGLSEIIPPIPQDTSASAAEADKWKRLYHLKCQQKSEISDDDCVMLVKHVMERSYSQIRSGMTSAIENDNSSKDPKPDRISIGVAERVNGMIKQCMQISTRNLLNQLPPVVILTSELRNRLTREDNTGIVETSSYSTNQFSVQESRLFPASLFGLSLSCSPHDITANVNHSKKKCIAARFSFGSITEKRDGILGSRYVSYEVFVSCCLAPSPFMLMLANVMPADNASRASKSAKNATSTFHYQDIVINLSIPLIEIANQVSLHQIIFQKRFRDFEELYISLTTGSQLNSYPICKHIPENQDQFLRHRLAWRAQQCVIPYLPSKDVYVSANPSQDRSILSRQVDLSEWVLFVTLHPLLHRHVSIVKFLNGNESDQIPGYWRDMIIDPQVDSLAHSRKSSSSSSSKPLAALAPHTCIDSTNWILEEDDSCVTKYETRDKVKRRLALVTSRINTRLPSNEYMLDASDKLCAALEKYKQCLADVWSQISQFATYHCKRAKKASSSSSQSPPSNLHVDQQYRISEMLNTQESAIRKSFLSLSRFECHSCIPSFQDRIGLIVGMMSDPSSSTASATVAAVEPGKPKESKKSSQPVVEVELAPILTRILVSEWSSFEIIRTGISLSRFKWMCQEMQCSSKCLYTSWKDICFQFSNDNYNFLISPSFLLQPDFRLWDNKKPKIKHSNSSTILESKSNTPPPSDNSKTLPTSMPEQVIDRPMIPESIRRLPTSIMSAIWSAINPMLESSFGWSVQTSPRSLIADDHFVVQPAKQTDDAVVDKRPQQRNDSEESQGYSNFNEGTGDGFVHVSDDDDDDSVGKKTRSKRDKPEPKNRTVSRSVSPSKSRRDFGYRPSELPGTVVKPKGKKKIDKALYSAMFDEEQQATADQVIPEPVLQKTQSEAAKPIPVTVKPQSQRQSPPKPKPETAKVEPTLPPVGSSPSWIKARPPSQRNLKATRTVVPTPTATSTSSDASSQSKANSNPNPDDDLPPGWSVVVMDDGRKYYYHNVTRISRWDKPSAKVVQEVEKQVQAGIYAFESRKKEMDDNQRKQDEARDEKDNLRPRITSTVDQWIAGAAMKGTRRQRTGPITSPSTTVEEVDLVVLLKTIPRYLSFVDEELVASLSRSKNPEASQVKRCYFSIVRFIHPDKMVGKSLEDRMLAESFFTVIASEFDDYRDRHQLN